MSSLFRTPRQNGRIVLVLAAVVLGYFFVSHALDASRVLDGERVFWLDDDQMISMRYARNLVRGRGLVWNEGERVEGYSNLGWTLVMAVAHLVPWVPATKRAVVVELAAWACTLTGVHAMMRLHRNLTGDSAASSVARGCIVLVAVTCVEVVFWAASGFETGALSALVTWGLAELVETKPEPRRMALPLALLPIVRIDAVVLWAPLVAFAAVRLRREPNMVRWLGVMVAPLLVSVLFRRFYYDDWFPNTYYLKVTRGPESYAAGREYAWSFAETYAVPLVVALGVLATRARKPGAVVLGMTLLVAAYVVYIGGDVFRPYRFFAPLLLPLLAVVGVTLAALLHRSPVLGGVLVALVAGVSLPRGWPWASQVAPAGSNGDPRDQAVVAMFLRKNVDPTTRIHVLAAGVVPYFTDLPAVDGLGKMDRHVARTPFRAGSLIGHGKHDFEYSLAAGVDVVITYRPADTALAYGTQRITPGSTDYVGALLATPRFVTRFLPNPVPDPYLSQHTALFSRTGWSSPPRGWAPVLVDR